MCDKVLGFTRISVLSGGMKPRKSSLLCAISFGLPFNPIYALLWHSTGGRRGRDSEIAPTVISDGFPFNPTYVLVSCTWRLGKKLR